MVAALKRLKDDAAALMVEHKRNALSRPRSIHPGGYAEVGIEVVFGGIAQDIAEVALAPGTEAQGPPVLPRQGVIRCLNERFIHAVLVLIVISPPPRFRQPVDA